MTYIFHFRLFIRETTTRMFLKYKCNATKEMFNEEAKNFLLTNTLAVDLASSLFYSQVLFVIIILYSATFCMTLLIETEKDLGHVNLYHKCLKNLNKCSSHVYTMRVERHTGQCVGRERKLSSIIIKNHF